MKRVIRDDLAIVLAGEAGQGIQAIEAILARILKRSGYNIFSASEFMSRVRGGANSTSIRVSSRRASGCLDRIDILVPLHAGSIPHLKKRITPETIVIGEMEKIGYPGMVDVPFTRIAAEIGDAVFANTVAVGLVCGLLRIDPGSCAAYIREYFAKKSEEVRERNAAALARGHAAGRELAGVEIVIGKNDSVRDDLLLSGSEAIALGALAGGCDYVCGYPMSPSTGVLERLASLSRKFDIIVEQVEDEIGVVNMALGAWYAGARALVTTSGGGFALMGEGISLCGMIESPLVLHLAQRPGPATGLPTRTEQGDLDLVLHAGHGDFPRVILAPGTPAQGFDLTRRAFDLAARYQVPVFVLTDQFFVDSRVNVPAFSAAGSAIEKHLVETGEGYQRFALTASGISPRGVPGHGMGRVRADSDEHDEDGFISEDLDLRARMVEKRLKKLEAVRAEAMAPTLIGGPEYRILVACWGSTLGTVAEAVASLGREEVAVLHFAWLHPLPDGVGPLLERAVERIVVENNSTASLARLLTRATGKVIDHRLLKYNGLPFSQEEVAAGIRALL